MDICSFFGHRNILGNIELVLEKNILYVIKELNIINFYVGGYGEFDRKALSIIKKIKRDFPDIKIYLSLAYLTVKKANCPISDVYDEVIYFEGLETVPKRYAIQKRNRIMVERSDVIICYIEREYGGAYSAVKYAKNKNKLILNCADNDIAYYGRL